MACACNKRSAPVTSWGSGTASTKKNTKATSWKLRLPDGTVESFGSEVEAQSARLRYGMGTVESA